MQRVLKQAVGLIAASALAAVPLRSGLAQDQAKPLRIIAPLAAGSTFDLLARAIAARLQQRIQQTVIVENRPGANMGLAANACRTAPADGQTLCLFTHNLFLNPLLQPKLSYDPIKDLEPVTLISYLEQVLVVSRRIPSDSFAALVQYSKAHPDTLNYGSVGVGSAAHLIIEWLRVKSGGDWKHVPFNGAPQVQAAIASGDIHLTFTPTGNVMGRIASGDLRALLTAGERRNPKLPNVQTFQEAGLPSLEAKSWAGLFVPAGTPQVTVSRLGRELTAITNETAFQQQTLTKLGLTPASMSRDAFKVFVSADQNAWKPLVKQAGLGP